MTDQTSARTRPGINRRQVLCRGSALAAASWAATVGLGALAQDVRDTRWSPTLHIRQGRLQGARFPGEVDAFYGIPYAASTAGDGRFMAPREAEPWTGVRQMLRVGNRSPQTLGGPISEVAALDRREPLGEDCLNLNVFTPATGGSGRPVMVWLHGGGFSSGSGGWLLYDGVNLARSQDVVVVTVNHRLNVFGHLNLSELGGERYADAANAGMLDIIAALQWVQDNIEAFGGSPDNVTIFGQSGGGGKVSTLLGMPAAQGLFHKAIAMSGANVQGVPADTATENAERLMQALDLRPDQVDRLQAMPMQPLLSAYLNTPGLVTAPVVDGLHLPGDPFHPSAPAMSASIPLMLGTTEHEMNFIPVTPLDPIDDADLLDRVQQTLRVDEAAAGRLIETYRQGRPEAENVELFQIIASDNTFRRDVLTQAERKAEQGQAPTWLYYFRWNSPVREGKLRAYHCLDIPFVFNNVDESASMTGAGQNRYGLADAMSGAFAAFARSGDPNHGGMAHWPRFDLESRSTMVFDTESRTQDDPFGDARRALYAATS